AAFSGQLASLEEVLRPSDLIQRVRSIVLSDGRNDFDLDFDGDGNANIQARMERAEAIAQGLGKAVSSDESAFGELIAELVTCEGRAWFFGRGLVEGSGAPRALWNRLVAQLASTHKD